MDSSLRGMHEIDNISIADSVACDIQDINKYIQIKKQDLTIISQNIRSIYCNFDNFVVTLSQLTFDADVLILTECRLDPLKSIPYIPNYNSFASINNLNQNDGVVVYAKTKLNPHFKEINLDHASCLQINILTATILGIYRSPSNQNASNFIDSLSSYIDTIKSQANVIITGDLNINIISHPHELSYERNNRESYLNMLAAQGILPGHTLPTRINNCLDHFMLRLDKKKLNAHVTVINTTITDHMTILLKISKIKTKISCTPCLTYIDYDEAVNRLGNMNLSDLLFSENPTFIIDTLLSKIARAIAESEKIKIRPKSQRTIKPWITEGILRCIRNRDKMQLKLRNDGQNEILKITFKRYRNFCNKIIKKLKHKYERDQLKRCIKNSKVLWNTIKTITYTKITKTHSTDLLTLKASPIESVNYVNDFFANVGKQLAECINDSKSSIDIPNTTSNTSTPVSSFVLLDTDVQEVHSVLMNLKSESAPGWDGIQTKFLKMVSPIIVPVITHLTNLCFRNGVFPSCLKKSIVTPVHKGGETDNVNNFRPISVLPAVSKILEKLINSRLIDYLDKFNILSNTQFGFRKGKSTEDAVVALTNLVTQKLDKGMKSLAIFLDLKKAFDTVSLPILVRKMEGVGIRGTPLRLLTSYLHDRTQRVKINNYTSNDAHISYGVPQGSVLGPTLFLIYLNGLTSLSLPHGHIFSYADDTAIIFSNASWQSVFTIAEKGLNVVSEWLRSNLLTLNVAKTNYICFSIDKRTQPMTDYKLKIHSCNETDKATCRCEVVNRVTAVKYLGVHLDYRLSWHLQIDNVNNRTRKLIWIFKKLRQVATMKLLKQIYIALAQSVIGYCIPVWGGATKTKFLDVERGQRCLLKVMHSKPRRFSTQELYQTCGLLSVRKLYILMTTLKVHQSLSFDPTLLLGRRRNHVVAPTIRCKTTFAKRQHCAQSSNIYNKLNKILNIYNLNKREGKEIITKWLQTTSYDEIEEFLK